MPTLQNYSDYSQSTLKKTQNFAMLIMAFLLLPFIGETQTSTDNAQNTVYKFTVTNITTPTQASGVVTSVLTQEFISACDFIDECDCFKLTSNATLTYEALKNALASDGYLLTGAIYVSDGRTIHATTNPKNALK